MIVGQFHAGSGLGDQIMRYITVRTLAQEKDFAYGMLGKFKGDFFLEQPNDVVFLGKGYSNWNEREIKNIDGIDIRSYDPEINFVEDNTIIDGSFEDSKYWGHNLANISKWLEVEPLNVADDDCAIGFRGGEYATVPDLFLTKDYWQEAIAIMLCKNPHLRFEVHTDDPKLARQFFPNISIVENEPISHSKHTNMGFNWRTMRYAKRAIIPNSAFFILPRLLKHHEDPTAVTIAPRGWARRNLHNGTWARPACYYKPFLYV